MSRRPYQTEESSGDFLARLGTDGDAWAREFVKQNPQVDLDTARAWFCNAIEAGRTAENSEGRKHLLDEAVAYNRRHL